MGQIVTAAQRNREAQAVKVQEMSGFIRQMQGEIARALPRHMDADRMARLVLTVVRKTPKLAETTPESFAGALLTASALGLEPGVNDEVYLVPYGNECQLIVGYKGLTKLFYQHPMASYVDAQAVHERDFFEYEKGTDAFLKHRPARGDRGDVIEYYAVARLSNGASAFEVMSPEEIALVRGTTGPNGGIRDPQHWMERKTVIKQLVKMLPKSTNLTQAVAADERTGSDLRRDLDLPAAGAPPLIEQTPQGAVDTTTGVLVEDPPAEVDEAGWPEVASVGGAA